MKTFRPAPLYTLMLLFLCALSECVQAQTIESLLRALQERRMILEMREHLEPQFDHDGNLIGPVRLNTIKWKGDLQPFPGNGTVTSIKQAIEVLNQVSVEFNLIQCKFVPFDPDKARFRYTPVHDEGGQGVVNYAFPSAGIINEENWQEKLRYLCSCVDQLRVLDWPIKVEWFGFEKTFPFSAHPVMTQPEGAVSVKGFDMTCKSDEAPITWVDYDLKWGWTPTGSDAGNPMQNRESGWDLLSWFGTAKSSMPEMTTNVNINAYLSGGGITGFETNMSSQNLILPAGAPTLEGKMFLLLAPRTNRWSSELMEAYVRDYPSSGLQLGKYKVMPIPKQNGKYKIGSLNTGFPFDSIDVGSAFKPIMQWMGLPMPTWGGLTNYGIDDLWQHSWGLQMDTGAPRVDDPLNPLGYSFAIQGRTLMAIPFTPCMTADSKQGVPLRYALGEVEAKTLYQPLRVHIGRGKSDANQQAWLTVRDFGFGTMLLDGSMTEFEAIYEDDPSSYPDQAVGNGLSGASLHGEFSPAQKAEAGDLWLDHIQYMVSWLCPRLRQVRGQDVLVDISYLGNYVKELQFYWAKEFGDLTGKFYDANGKTPFRTIKIYSPSAAGAQWGFPSERNYFRIDEGARRTELREPVHTDSYWLVYSIKEGTVGADFSVDAEETIKVRHTDEWKSIYESVATRGGRTVETVDRYGLFSGPLESEFPVLESHQVKVGAKIREIEWEWEFLPGVDVGDTGRWWKKKATCSGDAAWSENGREIEWAEDGFRSSERLKMGNKTLDVSYGSWSANKRNVTWKLDGKLFRSDSIEYGGDQTNHFRQVTVTKGTNGPFKFEYSDAGRLEEADFPGGYKELYSVSTTGDYTTLGKRSGWGQNLTCGLNSTLVVDRLGGEVSRSVVTTEGVTLDEAVGSIPTSWGAPQVVSDMRRGAMAKIYYDSGPTVGRMKAETDAFGLNRTVTYDDWLRPSSIGLGLESLGFDYTDPLKTIVKSDTGTEEEWTVSDFGEFRKFKTDFGTGSELKIDPAGANALTVDGRTVALGVDTSGFVSSIANGALNRGAAFEYDVENNQIFTKATENNKSGGGSANVVKTFYDALGRPVKMVRVAENGIPVTDQWSYDDANRATTYTPGAGPVAQTVGSVLSADGSTLTISRNGNAYLRKTRSLQSGGLCVVTELYDDTSGSGGNWREMTREVVAPRAGSMKLTPWGISLNAIEQTISAASQQSTRTISDGLMGDSLVTTLTKGVPTGVSGTVDGMPVALSAVAPHGLLKEVSGSIGGLSSGLKIGADRRLSELIGPGSSLNFSYDPTLGNGLSVSATDGIQGTKATVEADATGDVILLDNPDELKLSLSTLDTATGRQTTINGGLTVESNYQGGTTAKNYSAGISEAYAMNSDGTLSGFSVGGITAAVNETPTSRTITYGDGTVVGESFYNAGPRSAASGPNDARSFTYERLALRSEKHTAGPWSGWNVEFEPDLRGRLGKIKITHGQAAEWEFSLGYDGHSRLSGSISNAASAGYGARTAQGRLSTLNRGAVSTVWSYDGGTGLLSGVSHTRTGGGNLAYAYPGYDPRRRIVSRQASAGVSWSGLGYDGRGQLQTGALSTGRSVAYGYNVRGTRDGQGVAVAQTVNGLDQLMTRTLQERGFGLVGSVDKGANVLVKNAMATGWQGLSVNGATGDFAHWWEVPLNYQGGGAARIESLVRGILPAQREGDPPAVADASVELVVPPVNESLHYDSAGRQQDDAFWNYTWDNPGRLIKMTKKAALLVGSPVQSETLDFGYDADGRRTSKKHTRTYAGNVQKVEESQVLWAGWLPVLEERSVDGVDKGRRWFQWGADLSGTLDGAGGIGGLVAIIEEDATGTVQRTLLPVEDGIGNVTAVFDAASGAEVARYEYGPFGERLGGSGEMSCCPFQWQTRWYDEESELYMFPLRPYRPRTGTWLSRDPIGEAGGFNLYAYCGNDPVNRHDPLGLMTDEERVGLQSSNDILMAIVANLGGDAWTPDEVFNEKLKDSWTGNWGFNFMLPIPFLGERSKGFPWILQSDVGLDNKAQLRAQYPWWESDQDVALRESVRSNTVQAKSLLAQNGSLPARERLALQLRVAFGMWELTTIAATIPFQVPSAASLGARMPAIAGQRSAVSRGFIQPMDNHHTIPEYMGARRGQSLSPLVRYQHHGLHEFLDNWALPERQLPRFGAPQSFRGAPRPWARENSFFEEFARSRANREYIVEELRGFYKAHGYYYQVKNIFEREASLFIEGEVAESLIDTLLP